MKSSVEPTILVIFGATGNLMQTKVLPALFHLYESKELPELFSIHGVSNLDYSSEKYRDFVKKSIFDHLGAKSEPPQAFLEMFSHQKGQFEEKKSYEDLAKNLGQMDGEWKTCANKLYYLAVRPNYFETIFRHLAQHKLTEACSNEEGWTRVLVEKPFGKNVEDVLKLDELLDKLFREEQIYRIDHYLAKEILQNILLFRFANNLLENSWNNQYVDKIHVRVLENKGIDGRGDFYDGLGALLDVGQNHLLQMLSLVTMENPIEMTAEKVREKKAEVLQNLKILSKDDIKTNTVRAQYEGYRNEINVSKESTTETYFKIKAELDLPQWRGVPIYLESGKKMPRDYKEVLLRFSHPEPCLCEDAQHHNRNCVHFSIDPDPGISIKFWSKKPGPTNDLEEKWLDFRYESKELGAYFEEYPKVLRAAIEGEQTLFASSQESIGGLKFIEPIIEAWKENMVPLKTYSKRADVEKLAREVR